MGWPTMQVWCMYFMSVNVSVLKAYSTFTKYNLLFLIIVS